MAKVTRLKHGYVIRLSDTEWDVFGAIEGFALAGMWDESLSLTKSEKAALTRQMNKRGGFFLTVDEDRRGDR